MDNSTQQNSYGYVLVVGALRLILGFSKQDAENHWHKNIKDKIPPQRAFQRLVTIGVTLKRLTAKRFVNKHNELAVQLPLENLPSVLYALEQSMLPSDAQFLILHCPFIVLCTPQSLEINSLLLRAKLDSQGLYVGFVKHRPEIFLFPNDTLRKKLIGVFWAGSKSDFWRQIMDLPRKLDKKRIMRSVEAGIIAEKMIENGEPRHTSARLSHNLVRVFGKNALNVYQLLLAHDWTVADIQELDRCDHKWRENPKRLIGVEKALIDTGLEPQTARRLLIARPLFMYVPLATSCRVIDFFRDRGFEDDLIFAIAMRRPGLFAANSREVQQAYNRAQKEKKGLLWNTCKSAITRDDS